MSTISIYVTPKAIYKKQYETKFDLIYWHLTNRDEVIVAGKMGESLIKITVETTAIEKWLQDMERLICEQLKVTSAYSAVTVSSDDPEVNKKIKARDNANIVDEILRVYDTEESSAMDDLKGREQGKTKAEEKKETDEERIVRFSPEMTAYIEEVKHVTSALERANCMNQFYETALLVAVDEGQGYSAFLKVLEKELNQHYVASHTVGSVEHRVMTKNSGMRSWNYEKDSLKQLSSELIRKNSFLILSYDIREWVNDLSESSFLAMLRELEECAQNILLIFRISYMSKERTKEYEHLLSNVISIRSLTIPSASLESMVEYLKSEFYNALLLLEGECDELLGQWIRQEQRDGIFYGYKSLGKMVDEMAYQKALHSVEDSQEKSAIRRVTEDDIKNMLTVMAEEKDGYELLDELIGLEDIKKKIREMVSQIKLQKQMYEKGIDIGRPTLHMLFLGNPGTGKTTIARILGKIFVQEGLLDKGYFVEKTGSDFISGKVGTLAGKVSEICRESYGSVLFVDEAYAMSVGHSNGNITDETVPVFVAEMENHRDAMCVIFAGYQDEMEEFMKSNSGLKSRTPNVLMFPNYSRDELVEIFAYMIKDKFEYEEDFMEHVAEYMHSISDEALDSKEFSNARFVRNLYEQVWGKVAYRISFSEDKDFVLKKKDFDAAIEGEMFQNMIGLKSKNTIGFKID